MMLQKAPTRWAADFRVMLRTVLGEKALPVDVKQLAADCSRQYFPDDPISAIVGADLPGFEGALIPDPHGQRGWMILYDDVSTTPRRQRFTIAHEFGHYLCHRLIKPEGFRCKGDDFLRVDPDYRQMEADANLFATHLLMPLDDFRAQIAERDAVDFDRLGACADRYGVSLVAAALQWLGYTRKRAVLVLSRDGFVLWSWASDRAYQTNLFLKTAGRPPVEIPAASPANAPPCNSERVTQRHPEHVWFAEECLEMVLPSERYDFSISLLLFSDVTPDWDVMQANRRRALGSIEADQPADLAPASG